MDSPIDDIRIGLITSQWAHDKGLKYIYTPELESTNKLAKHEAFSESLANEKLALYLTEFQTSGRGRGTHTWSAPPGASLLSSWSFAVEEFPQPTTSCHFGLALYRACTATWPFLPWSLKAPNDIYLATKKVAGLLIETVLQGQDGRLIVGLGMNMTNSPSEVPSSTSLAQSLPKGAPLLGEDYANFLDRLLFEFSEAWARSAEPLTSTERLSLLEALNRFPLLKEAYTGMKSDGSLVTPSQNIRWSEL
jgi:BirA family biotin operon repressor/biotin-[acetyl-CoA-carboxylase] ligase